MKKSNRGMAIILVVVLLTTIVTCAIVYMQLVMVGISQTSQRQHEIQALYLAETAADEGLWYLRNVSANYTGESSHRQPEQGEYWFEVVSSRSVVGFGSVGGVQRTVSYNSNVLPLVYAVTQNLEGLNYALWLGAGSDFDWGPTLSVRGGSVASSRNIFFRGSGDKLVDRMVRVSGLTATVNISDWTFGSPSSQNVTSDVEILMNYDFTALNVYPGAKSIGGSYSGNAIVTVNGTITINGDLFPQKIDDSLALITQGDIVIESSVQYIKASLYAGGSLSIEGLARTVNIVGSVAINSGDPPLILPAGVSLCITYDPRLYTPTFGMQLGVPNPLNLRWSIR